MATSGRNDKGAPFAALLGKVKRKDDLYTIGYNTMSRIQLRQQLEPDASKERIAIVQSWIEEIESTMENNGEAESLIHAFNEATGCTYDRYFFENYWRSTDLETFARLAAQSRPNRIADVTRAELIEITQRIMDAHDDHEFYLELLNANVPHRSVSDLIYWPSELGYSDDLTAEEIVDIALGTTDK